MSRNIDDVDFESIDLSEFSSQIEKIQQEIEKIKKNKKIMKKLEKIKINDQKEKYDISQNNIDCNSNFKPVKNAKFSFKGNNRDEDINISPQDTKGLQPFC